MMNINKINKQKNKLENKFDAKMTFSQKDKIQNNIDNKNLELKNENIKYNHGWSNLIFLIAFFSVFRFLFINILQFGFRAMFPFLKYTIKTYLLVFLFVFINFMRSLALFYIKKCFNSYVFIGFSEFANSIFIYKIFNDFYLSSFCHAVSLIYTFKMLSFITLYKNNTFISYFNFLTFPTLVFKDSFPRKSERNFFNILKSIFKFIIYLGLFFILKDEYAMPAFYRFCRFDCLNEILESYLNFSVSLAILFYLFFRMIFDHIYGIISEITLFDEKIYGEWWNCRSSHEFWQSWNIPVHLFIKNHIYNPLISRKYSSHFSSFLCFLFSGIVHEYVISMSLKCFNGWFFVAMIMQIPLHYTTMFFKRQCPKFANHFFWITFCFIGQPMLTFLIYKTYYFKSRLY